MPSLFIQFSKNIWPLFIFIIGFWASQFISALSNNWQQFVLTSVPALAVILSFLLCLKFNRSKYLQALILCLLAYALPQFPEVSHKLHYSLSIGILSLLVLVTSFTKDRFLLSIHGFIRIIVLGSFIGLALYISQQYKIWLYQYPFDGLFHFPVQLSAIEPYLPRNDFLTLIMFSCCLIHLLATFISQHMQHSIFLIAQLCLLQLASLEISQVAATSVISITAIIVCLAVILASHDMAYRDELTSLPSRRALNQLLLSLGRKYTIAMMDIDHFKKFNDTHGHDVGDEVLRMVASKISKVTGGGKPFRYGGEEFTVVFPGKSPDQVEAHLDALRQTIQNYQMTVRSKKRKDDKEAKKQRSKKSLTSHGKLSVTISIGLAERGGPIKTPEQVIKAADEALYRAKEAGRNCVSR